MIDLKELLDDRSTTPADLAQHLRLHVVRGRIATRRRRRITAAGAFAAVLALLVVGYAVTPSLRAAPDPAVTPGPRLIEGFPEYAGGARVVAATRTLPGATSVSVTWVPTSQRITIFRDCHTAATKTIMDQSTTLNGRPLSWGGCSGSVTLGLDDELLPTGKPAVLTMKLTRADIEERTPMSGDLEQLSRQMTAIPTDVVMALAVGEQVPFTEYPLPPRPTVLSSLGSMGVIDHGVVPTPGPPQQLWSAEGKPSAPVTAELIWGGTHEVIAEAQTPGILHIAVNGIEVDTLTWWDYTAAGRYQLWDTGDRTKWREVPGFVVPAQGSRVVVTITPEHMTGDWRVTLNPRA